MRSSNTHCRLFVACVSTIILPLGSSDVSLLSSPVLFLVKAVWVVRSCLPLRSISFARAFIVVSFWRLGLFRMRVRFYVSDARKFHMEVCAVCFHDVCFLSSFARWVRVYFLLLVPAFRCVSKMQFSAAHIDMEFVAFVFCGRRP